MAAINEALAFLKTSDTVNYAATARIFNCDETTLRRRHQGKQKARSDADALYKSRLSKQQEQNLVAYIRKLSIRGIPPTLPMIRNFARDIAKIEVGKNWPYSFVQRHRTKLDCAWFDGFDIARKRADNASRYRAYFDLIREKIAKYDILPQNTYNMDEKGFLLGVINRTKRVFDVHAKKQGWEPVVDHIPGVRLPRHDLVALPPFLIYQGKPGQVQDSWLTEFDQSTNLLSFPRRKRAGRATSWGKSGWWAFSTALPRRKRETDAITASSSLTDTRPCEYGLSGVVRRDRIIVAVFPPHSTHRLQPLDVSLFGPLSTAYTRQLVQWTSKTQGLIRLSKCEFWTLFWSALEALFTPENIASGWRRTGLVPFDPDVILRQVSKTVDEEEDAEEAPDDSIALQEPTARELRRLVDQVVSPVRTVATGRGACSIH